LRKTVIVTSEDASGKSVKGNGRVCSTVDTVAVSLVVSYDAMRQEGIKDVEGVEDGSKPSIEDGFKDIDGELLGFVLGVDEGSVVGCSDGIVDGCEDGFADGKSQKS